MEIQFNICSSERCALVNDVLACSPIIGIFIFAVRASQFDPNVKSLKKQIKKFTAISGKLTQKSNEVVDGTQSVADALERSNQLITSSNASVQKLIPKEKEFKGNSQTQTHLNVSLKELESELKQIDSDITEATKISQVIDRKTKESITENSEIGDELAAFEKGLDEFDKQIQKNKQQNNRNVKLFIVSLLTTIASIVSMVALGILSVKLGTICSLFLGFSVCSSYNLLEKPKKTLS